MKTVKTLLALATLASAHMASAQTFQSQPYFGFEVGSTKVQDATGSTASSLVSSLGGSAVVTQDSSVQSYKLIGGYKVSENLDLELSYLKTSTLDMNFAGVSGGNVAYSGNVNVKFSGYEYSAIVRPSISSGWNNAYVKLGGHTLDADAGFRVTAGNVNVGTSASVSGTGLLVGVGYDYPVDKNTSLRFAWTRYSDVAGEDITAKFVSIGAIYKF
jgi:hypothetical protein